MYSDGVITLAPFDKEDLELVRAWVNDPDLARDINRVLPVTALEHEKWYANLVTRTDAVTFAIRHESKTIGLCGLKTIDLRNRHAELWLYIGEPGRRGQGLGRRSFTLLVRFGFDQLNLNRIHIYVAEYNKACLRACAACGFQEEGRFRDYIYIDGAYHDAISMAVLRHERRDVTTESMAEVCGTA
ncbi:MAG: GNAT family N-acetyltransferase [Planctomycetes bacterium]|nr:GNAT family N-acetyltransferase [Planctomycetota bacterium]